MTDYVPPPPPETPGIQTHESLNHTKEDKLNTRALFWKRVGLTALVGINLATLVIVAALVVLVRDTQQSGSPILIQMQKVLDEQSDQADNIEAGTNAALETNDRILDCLDPTGECYRESRKNSASQVLSITNVTIIAAACGPMVTEDMPLETRYAILRHCVAQFVEEPK